MSVNNKKILHIIQLLNEKQQILSYTSSTDVDEFTAACQEEAELHYINEELTQLTYRTASGSTVKRTLELRYMCL